VEAGDKAWVFSGAAGQPLRRSNFNHLAAQTPGATLRDLMVRMGHGTMRAALIYQHASRDGDRHIGDSLGERLAPLWPVAPGHQTLAGRADRPAREYRERTQNARRPVEDGRKSGGITRGGL